LYHSFLVIINGFFVEVFEAKEVEEFVEALFVFGEVGFELDFEFGDEFFSIIEVVDKGDSNLAELGCVIDTKDVAESGVDGIFDVLEEVDFPEWAVFFEEGSVVDAVCDDGVGNCKHVDIFAVVRTSDRV